MRTVSVQITINRDWPSTESSTGPAPPPLVGPSSLTWTLENHLAAILASSGFSLIEMFCKRALKNMTNSGKGNLVG